MASIISIRQQLIEFLPICGQYALSYSLENLSMMSFNPTIMVSTLDGFRLTRVRNLQLYSIVDLIHEQMGVP